MQFLVDYYKKVSAIVLNIDKKINPQIIKQTPKPKIKETFSLIENILEEVYEPYEYKNLFIKKKLVIYLKCFKNENLEKRIFGFQQILKIIQQAKQNDFHKR